MTERKAEKAGGEAKKLIFDHDCHAHNTYDAFLPEFAATYSQNAPKTAVKTSP